MGCAGTKAASDVESSTSSQSSSLLAGHFSRAFLENSNDRRLDSATITLLCQHCSKSGYVSLDQLPPAEDESAWRALAKAAGAPILVEAQVLAWLRCSRSPSAVLREPERPELAAELAAGASAADVTEPCMSMSKRNRTGGADENVSRDFRTSAPRLHCAISAVRATLPLTPRGGDPSTPRGTSKREGSKSPRASSATSSGSSPGSSLSISGPTEVKHLSHQASFQAGATGGAAGSACFTHEGGRGGRAKENQDTFFTCQPAYGCEVSKQLSASLSSSSPFVFSLCRVTALARSPSPSQERRRHLGGARWPRQGARPPRGARRVGRPREVSVDARGAPARRPDGRAAPRVCMRARGGTRGPARRERYASPTAAAAVATAVAAVTAVATVATAPLVGCSTASLVSHLAHDLPPHLAGTLAARDEIVLERIVDDDGGRWDAADGGSTATVAVLFGGRTLVVGAVGDSSALLLGRPSAASAAAGESADVAMAAAVGFEVLVEEHSATNVAEYERMCAVPAASELRFVWDCPDDVMIDVFASDAATGRAQHDAFAERKADREHACAVKNARGELVSVVHVPDGRVTLPSAESGAPGSEPAGAPAAAANGRRLSAGAGSRKELLAMIQQAAEQAITAEEAQQAEETIEEPSTKRRTSEAEVGAVRRTLPPSRPLSHKATRP